MRRLVPFTFLAFVPAGLVFLIVPVEAAKGYFTHGAREWLWLVVNGGLLFHMLLMAFGFTPLKPDPKANEKKPPIIGLCLLSVCYLLFLAAFLGNAIGAQDPAPAVRLTLWAVVVRVLKGVEGPWLEHPSPDGDEC